MNKIFLIGILLLVVFVSGCDKRVCSSGMVIEFDVGKNISSTTKFPRVCDIDGDYTNEDACLLCKSQLFIVCVSFSNQTKEYVDECYEEWFNSTCNNYCK